MSRVVLGVGIFFGALFASLVALGMSYPQKVVSAAASPHFEGLSPDTWLVDGASFTFPGLATSGNTLILQLESWRPESVGPAALLVEVCGRQNVEVLVFLRWHFFFRSRRSCYLAWVKNGNFLHLLRLRCSELKPFFLATHHGSVMGTMERHYGWCLPLLVSASSMRGIMILRRKAGFELEG